MATQSERKDDLPSASMMRAFEPVTAIIRDICAEREEFKAERDQLRARVTELEGAIAAHREVVDELTPSVLNTSQRKVAVANRRLWAAGEKSAPLPAPPAAEESEPKHEVMPQGEVRLLQQYKTEAAKLKSQLAAAKSEAERLRGAIERHKDGWGQVSDKDKLLWRILEPPVLCPGCKEPILPGHGGAIPTPGGRLWHFDCANQLASEVKFAKESAQPAAAGQSEREVIELWNVLHGEVWRNEDGELGIIDSTGYSIILSRAGEATLRAFLQPSPAPPSEPSGSEPLVSAEVAQEVAAEARQIVKEAVRDAERMTGMSTKEFAQSYRAAPEPSGSEPPACVCGFVSCKAGPCPKCGRSQLERFPKLSEPQTQGENDG